MPGSAFFICRARSREGDSSQIVSFSNCLIRKRHESALSKYRGRHLASNVTVRETNVSNWADTQYFVTLYLGSQRTALKFILDTGSSWFWVPSALCTTCQNSKFNGTLSKSIANSTNVQNVFYSLGFVSGTLATDTVSLLSNGSSNATGVQFLLVKSASNLSAMVADGILGLSA